MYGVRNRWVAGCASLLLGWCGSLQCPINFSGHQLTAGPVPASVGEQSATGTPLVFQDATVRILNGETVLQVADRRPVSKPAAKPAEGEAPAIEIQVQAKGTSDSKTRKASIDELPLDKLTPENRQRVQQLLAETSYFRRLPTTVIGVEPEVYQFFTTYPDAAVSIWRAMGISDMQLWQTGAEEYEGDAGDGTIGIIDVLYRGADQKLLLCEGSYQSPIMRKPIKARSLVVLTSAHLQAADGTYSVTHRADLFVSFPSQTIETAAKILSPITGPLVDRTFTEMSLFLRMMSLAMAKRPGWVEQMSGKMDGVPDVRKNQLLQLTAQMHNDERRRRGLEPIESITGTVPAVTMPPSRVSGRPAGSKQ